MNVKLKVLVTKKIKHFIIINTCYDYWNIGKIWIKSFCIRIIYWL